MTLEEAVKNYYQAGKNGSPFIKYERMGERLGSVTLFNDGKYYKQKAYVLDSKLELGEMIECDTPKDKEPGLKKSNRFNDNKDNDYTNYFSQAKEIERMAKDVNEEVENSYKELLSKVTELEKEKELLKQRTDKAEKESNEVKVRLSKSERANTVISMDLEKIKKENSTLTNKVETLENQLLEVSKVVANIKTHYLHLLEKFTGHPSITEGQILQAKRLLEQGLTERQIAQEVGVSKGTVWRIKNNKL